MSLVATIALAASSLTLPHCSWDKPGMNPFMGDLVAAVDRYRDIPAATRAKLKARMQERRYDEIVDIRRDGIVGRHEYGSDIRDMHFGTGQVCQTVSRGKWSTQQIERGLVYCEDGQCLLVPTVCRNLSRISRGGLLPPAASATTAAGNDEGSELMFEPPAAGENGGASAISDPGSFLRVANLPTIGESLIASPNLGGGNAVPPGGGMGLITLPGVPQGNNGGGGGTSPPIVITPPPAPPITPPIAPSVPEPSTHLLFGVGLTALILRARKRVKRC